MQKWIGISLVVAVAVAAAGGLLAARALPGRSAALPPPVVPAGNKPFARICKSDEVIDARPTPAWVRASFASDNCRAPSMPAMVDGFSASREQIVAVMEAGNRYAAAADVFEQCVADFVASRKANAGKGGKPLSNSLVIIENHRVFESQRNRKLVSARIDGAINDFNEFGSGCPE